MRKIILTVLMAFIPLIGHAATYEITTPGNNVGIGSTNPNFPLDVVGTARFTNIQGMIPTTVYQVDCNRTDTYPANATQGSETWPYKTLGALITGIGTPAGSIAINMKTASCVEASPTFPNVQIVLNTNGSTIVTGSGAGNGTITFQNYVVIRDGTIVGSIVQSSTATSYLNMFDHILLEGSLTVDGYAETLGGDIIGTGTSASVITMGTGSFLNIIGTQIGLNVNGTTTPNYYSRILAGTNSTLIMTDDQVYCNEASNNCIDVTASGSTEDISLVRAYQYGNGGGLSTAGNGGTALVNPDSISHFYMFMHSPASSANGIVSGTNDMLTDMYVLTYNFDTTGVAGYATGTNITGRAFGALNTPLINGFSATQPLALGTTTNVGIGTTLPMGALDVEGTVNPVVFMGNANSKNVGIGTWLPQGLLVVMGGNVGIGSLIPGVTLEVNGTLRNTGEIINGSGPAYLAANVGIGSTVPGQVLDVAGTARITGGTGQFVAPGMVLSVQGTIQPFNGTYVPGNNFNLLDVQGTLAPFYALTVNSNGNVGIGSASPGIALDVQGSLRFITDKSTTGVRYLCINTAGVVDSQSAACVGT